MKLFTTFLAASQCVSAHIINEENRDCDFADPCEGKDQCTTFVDGCGTTPVRGHLVGTVDNPPKHFRVSFDFKCLNTTLEYADLPNRELQVLELSTSAPGEEVFPGDGSSQVAMYTSRDNPLELLTVGNFGNESLFFCKHAEWDGLIMQQVDAWNETSVAIIRKSDSHVLSYQWLSTDDIETPERFYAYVSHEADWPAQFVEVKNFIFERL